MSGHVQTHLSATLPFEYETVFMRERQEMGLSRRQVGELVNVICELGAHHRVHFRWRHQTPDPKDACVLEAAVAAPVGTRLVTHNLKDFREAASLGVEAITPGALPRRLREAGRL